ncbi:hypothetical protein QBC34DRAFT_79635 [Podospora aff. communis PSN243]|uniref:Uncharacterized protein n=1 Tax=Podospora aff. communis PSN243 TaxID=3040156 RepID=A0AAV9GPT7_9PEZI|nr:hypothetical protein QBC34DRAFT_79635 [Podospora aff. communis PSN243]
MRFPGATPRAGVIEHPTHPLCSAQSSFPQPRLQAALEKPKTPFLVADRRLALAAPTLALGSGIETLFLGLDSGEGGKVAGTVRSGGRIRPWTVPRAASRRSHPCCSTRSPSDRNPILPLPILTAISPLVPWCWLQRDVIIPDRLVPTGLVSFCYPHGTDTSSCVLYLSAMSPYCPPLSSISPVLPPITSLPLFPDRFLHSVNSSGPHVPLITELVDLGLFV